MSASPRTVGKPEHDEVGLRPISQRRGRPCKPLRHRPAVWLAPGEQRRRSSALQSDQHLPILVHKVEPATTLPAVVNVALSLDGSPSRQPDQYLDTRILGEVHWPDQGSSNLGPVMRYDTPLIDSAAALPHWTRGPVPARIGFAAATLLLLPGSMHVAALESFEPMDSFDVPEAIPGSSNAELTALRERHGKLTAELETSRSLTTELTGELDTLSDSHDRLEAENDALIRETTDLNQELLELELALAALDQATAPEVKQETVYNFVNVPIGTWVDPDSGVAPQSVGAQAYSEPVSQSIEPLAINDMSAADEMVQEVYAETLTPDAYPDTYYEASGDELVAAFYRDLQGGEPLESLHETLDEIGGTGQVSGDKLHSMYQELMYLWEE